MDENSREYRSCSNTTPLKICASPFKRTVLQRIRGRKRMAVGCGSTGISPRPMLMGATHDALRASNARVSLSCLRVLAHRLAHLFCGPVFIALLFVRGPVLRTCNRLHGAPAGRLHTDRSYPSALCCAGGLPPGFLCQGAITGRRVERGKTRSARLWISSGQNPGWK